MYSLEDLRDFDGVALIEVVDGDYRITKLDADASTQNGYERTQNGYVKEMGDKKDSVT